MTRRVPGEPVAAGNPCRAVAGGGLALVLVLVLVPVLRRVGGTAAVGTAALVFVLDAGVGVGVGTVEGQIHESGGGLKPFT